MFRIFYDAFVAKSEMLELVPFMDQTLTFHLFVPRGEN